MLRLSETHRFLQSSSFWEARRALIGQLSSALWLGLGTELGTFKGTYQIASVLPSIDSH